VLKRDVKLQPITSASWRCQYTQRLFECSQAVKILLVLNTVRKAMTSLKCGLEVEYGSSQASAMQACTHCIPAC